ncbi:MAG: acetyl-CoA decarbonylase/synthase complex subunit delta, partial [Methanoregulaceae archaeon]|nr:acetyl-CoA decarbonylase/synthase complex subunit delta [Methanoregulaceae archaeon]
MAEGEQPERTTGIGMVQIGATTDDGGTRGISYRIGGEENLPFIGLECGGGHIPLVALEICDDPASWPAVVAEYVGDAVHDPASWAGKAEREYGADLVRLYLTSTVKRDFADFTTIGETIGKVLSGTSIPLAVEGVNDPSIDSEVFARVGEAGEGERLLLGTAEAGRYRSIAAAALAYNHSVIAQSPIDVNLAKQLNILLREIGVKADQILIDPYTGALGYGFEYSFSVMERIRYAALKGDADLAMPMISSAIDSLNVREVREADDATRGDMAVAWEFYAAFSSAVAGAAIVCVRHPRTVGMLHQAFHA